jgi:hypothetical protein
MQREEDSWFFFFGDNEKKKKKKKRNCFVLVVVSVVVAVAAVVVVAVFSRSHFWVLLVSPKHYFRPLLKCKNKKKFTHIHFFKRYLWGSCILRSSSIC